jgi:hypothetical protein
MNCDQIAAICAVLLEEPDIGRTERGQSVQDGLELAAVFQASHLLLQVTGVHYFSIRVAGGVSELVKTLGVECGLSHQLRALLKTPARPMATNKLRPSRGGAPVTWSLY